MKLWRIVSLLLPSWVALEAASLVSEGQSVSFTQAKEIILEYNEGLKSARTRIEAVQAGTSLASVLQNPEVEILLEKFGTREFEASVAQTIELGGKREIRSRVVDNEVAGASNAFTGTRLELECEIVRRFITVDISAKKMALLDSIIKGAESTHRSIAMKVEAGAAKKTDLLRAEIEIERLRLEQSGLVNENVRALRMFAALGGDRWLLLLHTIGSIADECRVPPLDDLKDALKNAPELKAADIELDRFAIEQRQRVAETFPDLVITAGFLRDNVDRSNAPLAGLAMCVPLFNRNVAVRQQMMLQHHAGIERRANLLRQLEAETETLHGSLVEIDKQLSALSTGIIPKARDCHTMMQEYYAAGKADYLDLSAALAEVLRLRMDFYTLQNERAQHLADLMRLTTMNIQIVK